MFSIVSIFDGQIVCTLADGNTLRLDKNVPVTIKEEEMTDYLRNLESRGYIVITKIEAEEKASTKKKTSKKSE